MCLGSVGLRLEPTELEEQETAPREAGSGQNMQGLGSHTKNPVFHAKGKGSEQSGHSQTCVLHHSGCCVHNTLQEEGSRKKGEEAGIVFCS